MGYTTEFKGSFAFDKPLTGEQTAYLQKFAETRRMWRDASKAEGLPDATRTAVGLPVGCDGGYFTGGLGFAGQDDDASVLDHNTPPLGQPGLWCKWAPNDDGTELIWDGREKFRNYIEWLKYLIEHFFTPWGVTLSGHVEWRGEDFDDRGVISIEDSQVHTREP